MKVSEQYTFGSVVAVVILGFILVGTRYLPQSRLAPLVIGVPSLALMLINMWALWLSGRRSVSSRGPEEGTGECGARSSGSGDAGTGSDESATLARELSIIGWIVGFTLGIWLIGFTLAIPIFLFLMAWVKFRESPVVSLSLALVVGAGLYLAFDVLLKVPMSCGILL